MAYYLTPETIKKANDNLKALDSKFGGLLCILHCIPDEVEENRSYEINGSELRKELTFVFDKDPKDSFDTYKSSFIIFAKEWAMTFFSSVIKNKIDLLSCAVFFLRRFEFKHEATKDEISEIFIKRYHLQSYRELWFFDGDKCPLNYNQMDVEDNQNVYYRQMGYDGNFKSLLFNGKIQKSAADLKAAGQIQTLYSGSIIQTCFLLSDESLDKYYVMQNSKSADGEKDLDSTDAVYEDILNHTLYGIHIKLENDALHDEHPHICIGWSSMGDLTAITTKGELEAKYKETWTDNKARAVGQNVGQIWRFIKEANIGDYVIFADGEYCHIGRIESDYYYNQDVHEGQSPDYVNTRDVVWLKKYIRRSELSESMHRSLMTAMSFWTMNDYRAAIADLINGTYIKDEPVEDSENIPPAEQREHFKQWMTVQKKSNGEPYSSNTVSAYISQMEHGYAEFERVGDYESIFEIQNVHELKEYREYLFNASGFDEFNERAGNKACSNGLIKYIEYVSEVNRVPVEIIYKTDISILKPRNRILFGAPGTGKSYAINNERIDLLGVDNETDYERVTFHPDYTYANFVGTYKPVPCEDENGNDSITYKYVPGPFMRIYVNALKSAMSDKPRPYLLIIEEINRANVAAVFGDVFQLLDRKGNISEYPIQASEDIKKYLSDELKCKPEQVEKIRIPDNMFIWATMNSADQGVFPMDTAFKRRWDFDYIGINHNMDKIDGYTFNLPNGRAIRWNRLRIAINNRLASLKVNEDKLLGPFFIAQSVLDLGDNAFISAFENKVLMYLFEDAGKQRRTDIFRDNQKSDGDVLLYSVLCENFRENGIDIFCDEITKAVTYESNKNDKEAED